MHDTGAMRRVERRSDLNRHGQRLRQRERALLEARGQRLAVQQFHHEEVDFRRAEALRHIRRATEALRRTGRDVAQPFRL